MLTEITGDLLKIRDGIICHQVNYLGVMGGGVAAAIASDILNKDEYDIYKDYCKRAGRTALGTVLFIGCMDRLIVANMFCQDCTQEWRRDSVNGWRTDYDAMRKCLIRVRSVARLQGKAVYFPHNLGCGIAGGDWNTVKYILKDVFEAYPEEAYIVCRKGIV